MKIKLDLSEKELSNSIIGLYLAKIERNKFTKFLESIDNDLFIEVCDILDVN